MTLLSIVQSPLRGGPYDLGFIENQRMMYLVVLRKQNLVSTEETPNMGKKPRTRENWEHPTQTGETKLHAQPEEVQPTFCKTEQTKRRRDLAQERLNKPWTREHQAEPETNERDGHDSTRSAIFEK